MKAVVQINRVDTKEKAIQKASEALNKLLEEARGGPVLLLLSGGSSFSLLEGVREGLLGKGVTISVLDERYSEDPTINNFLQLQTLSFYRRALSVGCSFIPTSIASAKSLEEAAEFFGHELRNWKTNFPQGTAIITQGMGDDGHTSGIMPFPESESEFRRLFEGERWVVGYNAQGKNPYPLRVTATVTFLKYLVDHSILFVSGESKKRVFEKLEKGELPLCEMPAQVVWQMKDVKVFACLT